MYNKGIEWLIEENIKHSKNRAILIDIIVKTCKTKLFKGIVDIEDIDKALNRWNFYFKTLKEKYTLDYVFFIDKEKLTHKLKRGFSYDVEIIPRIVVRIVPAHNWSKAFNLQEVKLIPRKYGYCPAPWTSCAISWNGDCAICCTDYDIVNNIGNIKENTVLEIWNSKKMQKIRANMNNCKIVLPLCQRYKAFIIPKRINYNTISYVVRHYRRALRG